VQLFDCAATESAECHSCCLSNVHYTFCTTPEGLQAMLEPAAKWNRKRSPEKNHPYSV